MMIADQVLAKSAVLQVKSPTSDMETTSGDAVTTPPSSAVVVAAAAGVAAPVVKAVKSFSSFSVDSLLSTDRRPSTVTSPLLLASPTAPTATTTLRHRSPAPSDGDKSFDSDVDCCDDEDVDIEDSASESSNAGEKDTPTAMSVGVSAAHASAAMHAALNSANFGLSAGEFSSIFDRRRRFSTTPSHLQKEKQNNVSFDVILDR